MAKLNDVIKVTSSQYSTLITGGSVSGKTYDENSIYLVDDTVTFSTVSLSNGSLSDGVYLFYYQAGTSTSPTISFGAVVWKAQTLTIGNGGTETSATTRYGTTYTLYNYGGQVQLYTAGSSPSRITSGTLYYCRIGDIE